MMNPRGAELPLPGQRACDIVHRPREVRERPKVPETLSLQSCRRIDFGAKGYGNLVELASLQQHVAGQLGKQAGRLLMIVKSAHVYETERGYLRDVLTRDR
jgi:thymidylate synthase